VNKNKYDEQSIFLPVSECFTAQLPSYYTSDRKYATELANCKISPSERLNLIDKFVKTLNKSKEIESWGIEF
jgi:hypothetical protein